MLLSTSRWDLFSLSSRPTEVKLVRIQCTEHFTFFTILLSVSGIMQNLKRQVARFGAPMSPSMFDFLRRVRGPTIKLSAILIPLFLKVSLILIWVTSMSALSDIANKCF